MDTQNSNLTNTFSPAKVYILISIFIVLVILIFTANLLNINCEQYLYSTQYIQQQYNITPDSCLEHYINKALIPSIAMALPFVFIAIILFLKEKKKEYQINKAKHENIAFWLLIFTVLFFLISLILIKNISCDGFGCLSLAPIIASSITIFPLLIFVFSLWFLKAHYQWKKQKFIVIIICLLILLLVGYLKSPLV